MKTPAVHLVEKVLRLGGRIETEGAELKVALPKGSFTPALKQELKTYKAQLLKLEIWDFQRLEIPNQTDPDAVDIWMYGEKNAACRRWWFVRTEKGGVQ